MKAIAAIVVALMSLVSLSATEDRICAVKDFQLVAAPEKATFTEPESVTVRLVVTNRTQREAWIVPHLYPFDYWVDKESTGQWKPVAGFVPASRSRKNMPLGPRDASEYRSLKPGETYSTTFVVAPEMLGQGAYGRFRIRVRAYVKETRDINLRDIGCAMFAAPVVFSTRK